MNEFQNYLHFPDPTPIYALMGSVAANFFEGIPVWLMLVGPPGCQPRGSKVLRADGTWDTVENVKVGDKIASPQLDGSSVEATVLETFVVPDMPTYRIGQLRNGQITKSYKCAGNHTLAIAGARKQYVRGSGKYTMRKQARMAIDNMTVDQYLQRGEQYQRRSKCFTTTAIELPAHTLPVDPYVLGALLGDGGLTGTAPKFTTADKAILQRMEEAGVEFGKGYQQPGNAASTYSVLWPYSIRVKNLPCYWRSSHDKFIPAEYKLGSISQRLQLLAGLIDTDGSTTSYTTVSPALACDFVDLVHSVGGYANISHRHTTCNGAEFPSYRVHYCFGEHVPELVMAHKQRLRTGKLMNIRHKKMQVLPVGRETVYGFRLDSPSQWYVTDDWMVTHNCGKTAILESLMQIPRTRALQEITGTGSLLSGTGAKEKSKEATGGVLREIGLKGTLILNEFTSILSMPSEQLIKLLAAFRMIYDGMYSRDVGSDGARKLTWGPGKLGAMAGCTESIDDAHKVIADMGERWIFYRFPDSDGYQEALAASKQKQPTQARTHIREIVSAFFDSLDLGWGKDGGKLRERRDLTLQETQRIIAISTMATRCRSAVIRDARSREVERIPQPERAPRMVEVLTQLYIGLEAVGLAESDRWAVISRIALDCMPQNRRRVLEHVVPLRDISCVASTPAKEIQATNRTIAEFQARMKLSMSTVKRITEELEIHGVLERTKENRGIWTLTDWSRQVVGMGWNVRVEG